MCREEEEEEEEGGGGGPPSVRTAAVQCVKSAEQHRAPLHCPPAGLPFPLRLNRPAL